MTSPVRIPADTALITRRGVSRIISEDAFVAMLQRGRPLRLKMGFDPSRPDIHLGHVVGLRKLRQLQDLGHQVILIVGDWTAQIGDPSGQFGHPTRCSPMRAGAWTTPSPTCDSSSRWWTSDRSQVVHGRASGSENSLSPT